MAGSCIARTKGAKVDLLTAGAGMRIEIRPGDTAWELAAPLFAAVWPPELRATFSWAHVVWANAERRVLVWSDAGELVCHVGVYARQAKWGDDTIRIGGIGGVITRQDSRKQGYASAAMGVAVAELRTRKAPISRCWYASRTTSASISASAGGSSPATFLLSNPKAECGSMS